MSESASDAKIRELSRQLKNEKREHSETRRMLQREIERVWRLVPSHYITLMGVYPPLRKLFHVLAEAADLQDPSRGAPIEDVMRTQFVHVGDNASTSHTEAAVSSHARVRHNTQIIRTEMESLRKYFTKLLEDKARTLARLVGSEEWEYELPDAPVCWRKTTDKDGNIIWECPMRGRKQPYSAWYNGCGGCQREFELERTGT